MSLINKLPLIPIIRTTRAISAYTILPNHPLIAITMSEIISYTIPFIYNSPVNALNDMILFIFYIFYYNKSSLSIIDKYKKEYYNYYLCELLLITIFLFIKI